jgi:hypothetical protein
VSLTLVPVLTGERPVGATVDAPPRTLADPVARIGVEQAHVVLPIPLRELDLNPQLGLTAARRERWASTRMRLTTGPDHALAAPA